jgi:hypothetical protein
MPKRVTLAVSREREGEREREHLNKRNGIQKLLLQKQNKLTHHSLPNPKKTGFLITS